jgi:pyrroline-5-carboxylate reductase
MTERLSTVRITFIGGGNMARALIGGLIDRGVPARNVCAADPVVAQLDALETRYGVGVTQDNVSAVQDADVTILAVKPQEMRSVATLLAPRLTARRPLLVSVAAGIRATDIQHWVGSLPVVRAMPNRPALHGHGITALFATSDVPAGHRELAEEILGAVGATLWLEREADMDTVTAVSASGPAYYFLLTEILEETGISLGLSPQVSRKLAVETAYGAGAMTREALESAATLREQVTSRGGTTEAALRHLESNDVRGIFAAAIAAAARRAAQLADEFGGNQRD